LNRFYLVSSYFCVDATNFYYENLDKNFWRNKKEREREENIKIKIRKCHKNSNVTKFNFSCFQVAKKIDFLLTPKINQFLRDTHKHTYIYSFVT
jgi:hypothetical protein